MAAAARTLEGRWRLQPLVSAGHCVWEDRREPWEQGGQVVLGGFRHRLCWLMGDCQGFGGDRVSNASSCPKPLLLFSRGTQLPSLCRARAVGDPEEIGGSSQQGSRGLLSPPPPRTPVHDHLRFGDWFGKPSELLNAVPKVSVEPQALKVLSEELMCLIFSRGWPGRRRGRQYLHSAQKGKPVVCGDLLRE